ncbi:MAG TPA: phospholipase A [Methylibium sp.]|uniref:phospholipase A n=1 Tax=Methylibium sp. TaxID=2067992 RepID=UPI002DB9718E|nr:phospholipase A [Methylibium sp.]HEU4459008.1 phospholipase A [Methylibium sp.]
MLLAPWVASAATLAAPPADAISAPPDTLASCAATSDDGLRLACYDRLAGRPAPAAAPTAAGRTPDVVALPAADGPSGTGLAAPATARPSFLSKFWELDAADKRGIFNFTGYRPNFVLPVHRTSRLNQAPSSPTRGVTVLGEDYQNTEAKFQLSLRTKVAEDVGLPGADLWFGYTQQSLWQFYNSEGSKPFRSTDYEPEAMYVVPVPVSIGTLLPFDWRWRMATLGLAHQSNGQPDPLSRSWNRLYLATGFERGDWSVQWRVNRRFREDPTSDDNPDLVGFRGRHELQLGWTRGHGTAALQWRTNFKDFKRGSWQLDWSYPVNADDPRALRWYLQLFSGYGETLLDYNFRQTSLGVGLSLFEF